MTLPTNVNIVEVGPRDGLQNESPVSARTKIRLIDLLSDTGLSHIEAGSFVSPKWVPQMADSKEVMQNITRRASVTYSALTPNLQGLEQALDAGANQVAIFTSTSEDFCQHNINCSIAESLKRFEPLMVQADKYHIPVRGYLSCVVDCPYDGATSPTQVANISQALIELGCYEVSLGDTIGTGTPNRIKEMLESVLARIPNQRLAVHFHDTWGQALANIYQALSMGINTVDSSVAGLGGCPYAHGASGNVATEDVLYLCQGLGIETGVDLELLAKAGWMISDELQRQPTSKVSQALRHRME
ncbi:hydroxymethylglutaryl-CoA lyase [Vibrio parahaemolyticus]|uniref:hydroxymethylglutaryl-CoA lyase n=1 Tax=Vibrio parahaemolyticus TaxID=670 RepID=A0AA46Z830_VIBPH|nr:hydroxymethylglutaryl-CoA lyase [Vibrio parahaemolyticus]KIT43912.1 hydroxymethylglutaryl-CoA lyase [Vibrio parahaemolyticus 3644]KIT56881.1 hydroxymethylglutaryl-CoA lyase [Vibrio parahaemolyticus EN9701072]EGQ8083909.1 hydroxymethylglutaryl-CoA lyase [Vibrio parahaemolyticus]EGQ8242037.1 hydroxymethylglutaryl-CoA lyase [Vibrio parahaemolyticus]EGQ8384235.1 hydroxymethylglutaryl-CoA lyase [Vibrio parahaemolyticus]